MELAVFLPTLLLAIAFAAAILLYSLQKVFGPSILSFRNKTHVGTSADDASSQPGWTHYASRCPSCYRQGLILAFSCTMQMCNRVSTEQDALVFVNCRGSGGSERCRLYGRGHHACTGGASIARLLGGIVSMVRAGAGSTRQDDRKAQAAAAGSRRHSLLWRLCGPHGALR